MHAIITCEIIFNHIKGRREGEGEGEEGGGRGREEERVERKFRTKQVWSSSGWCGRMQGRVDTREAVCLRLATTVPTSGERESAT